MNVDIRETTDSVAAAAADHIAERAHEAVAARGIFTVAFSGGSTPGPMLEQLAKRELPWDAVHVFQVDERVAPDQSPDRNFTALREQLLSRVHLRRGRLHPMPVGVPSLAEAAERYGETLRGVCGDPPVLDLVHLGLGDDGHTASLFPGSAALDVADAAVTASGEARGFQRLTLTVPVLNAAREVLWLVTGAGKRQVLRALVQGEADIPANRIQRDRAVIFTDRAAAEDLEA